MVRNTVDRLMGEIDAIVVKLLDAAEVKGLREQVLVYLQTIRKLAENGNAEGVREHLAKVQSYVASASFEPLGQRPDRIVKDFLVDCPQAVTGTFPKVVERFRGVAGLDSLDGRNTRLDSVAAFDWQKLPSEHQRYLENVFGLPKLGGLLLMGDLVRHSDKGAAARVGQVRWLLHGTEATPVEVMQNIASVVGPDGVAAISEQQKSQIAQRLAARYKSLREKASQMPGPGLGGPVEKVRIV